MSGKWISAFIVLLSLSAAPLSAQEVCPALVNQALSAIGTNCTSIGRNTVCYGNNEVRASFFIPVAEDVFSRPADQTDLVNVATIATTSLSLERTTWGVAVMNVQANVPDSLPGQAVTFVLLGDSEIENAVSPEAVPVPTLNIYVTTLVNSILRSGAGTNFNRLGRLDAQTVLVADAVSADGQWVRVVADNETIAWIARENLVNDAVIDSLKLPDTTSRGTMQAFYLRTGIGSSECAEAPQEALIVQGPQNFKVSLTVNGAQVNLGSTVVFRTIGDNEDQLEISVLDGEAEVLPAIEGAQATVITAGRQSVFCLDDAQNRGSDGQPNDKVVTCNGTPPQRIPTTTINASLCSLQDLPEGLLRYPIDLQCPGDPLPLPPVPVQTSTPTVQQTAEPQQPTDPFANCVITVVGPYGQVSQFNQVFQWIEVPNVDGYRIDFLDTNGSLITSIDSGLTAGVNADPASLLSNYPTFQYQVVAFKNGQIVCRSGVLGAAWSSVPSFDAAFVCTTYPYATVSWNNAQANDTVTFEIPSLSYSTVVGSGGSGSGGIYIPTTCPAAIVRTSSGASYNLGAVSCGC